MGNEAAMLDIGAVDKDARCVEVGCVRAGGNCSVVADPLNLVLRGTFAVGARKKCRNACVRLQLVLVHRGIAHNYGLYQCIALRALPVWVVGLEEERPSSMRSWKLTSVVD